MNPQKMNMSKPDKLVQCEIISVACPQFVVSSRRRACRYEKADGAALANGYYLAVWPAGANRSSYGREVRYFGPYETETVARIVQLSALWLGLIEPGPDGVDSSFLAPATLNSRYRLHNPWLPISEMRASL
ncbi:MAG: hypothetical protein M0Q22_01320 [Sulfuritalea sp.]|nr:hypothetical protein [Sulfuritalea sp.]